MHPASRRQALRQLGLVRKVDGRNFDASSALRFNH
jgi:hypothetical protein